MTFKYRHQGCKWENFVVCVHTYNVHHPNKDALDPLKCEKNQYGSKYC